MGFGRAVLYTLPQGLFSLINGDVSTPNASWSQPDVRQKITHQYAKNALNVLLSLPLEFELWMIPPLSPSPAGKNALLNKNMKVYRTVDYFNGFGMTNILVSLHVVIVAFEALGPDWVKGTTGEYGYRGDCVSCVSLTPTPPLATPD